MRAVTEAFEDDRSFQQVDVLPNPDDPNIFAVLWDDGFWFKSLRVLRFEHGNISWSAVLQREDDWGDNAILGAQWVKMPKIGMTALEVYTSSHRGNGCFLLERLKGKKLQCILSARSISRYAYNQPQHDPNCDQTNWSEQTEMKGKIVSPGNDDYEEVVVAGDVSFFDDAGKLIGRRPVDELYRWNAGKRKFQKNASRRIGD